MNTIRLLINDSHKKIADSIQTTPEIICKTSGNYMVGHDMDCASFYMCENGTATVFMCPENMLFNLEVNKCENATMVYCDKRPTLMPMTTPEPEAPINNCNLY